MRNSIVIAILTMIGFTIQGTSYAMNANAQEEQSIHTSQAASSNQHSLKLHAHRKAIWQAFQEEFNQDAANLAEQNIDQSEHAQKQQPSLSCQPSIKQLSPEEALQQQYNLWLQTRKQPAPGHLRVDVDIDLPQTSDKRAPGITTPHTFRPGQKTQGNTPRRRNLSWSHGPTISQPSTSQSIDEEDEQSYMITISEESDE